MKCFEIVKQNFNLKKFLSRFLVGFSQQFSKNLPKNWKIHYKICQIIRQIQPDNPVSINDLKETFFALQTNKSPDYDGKSFNVVKHCFDSLHKSLLHVFNWSPQKGLFPDELKIVIVTPAYKNNGEINLENYRPITVVIY